jgi:hypothetical protein
MADIESTGVAGETVEYVEDDLDDLKQHWVNEVCSPELFVYQKDLIESLRQKLATQEDLIDEERDGDANAVWRAGLYELEMDRVNYLLRGYHRVRLAKVRAWCVVD